MRNRWRAKAGVISMENDALPSTCCATPFQEDCQATCASADVVKKMNKNLKLTSILIGRLGRIGADFIWIIFTSAMSATGVCGSRDIFGDSDWT